MRFGKIQLSALLILVAAVAVLGVTEQASAQTADLAGAWTLTVSTDNGITNPFLTLEQEGESLTGHYSSEALGEEDVTGTVSGSDFTISFSAELQGQVFSVLYRGTVDEHGEMSGTLSFEGNAIGDFTAKRSDR